MVDKKKLQDLKNKEELRICQSGNCFPDPISNFNNFRDNCMTISEGLYLTQRINNNENNQVNNTRISIIKLFGSGLPRKEDYVKFYFGKEINILDSEQIAK